MTQDYVNMLKLLYYYIFNLNYFVASIIIQEVARKLFPGDTSYLNITVDQQFRIRGPFAIHRKMVGILRNIMEENLPNFQQAIGTKTILFIPRDTDVLSVQICQSQPETICEQAVYTAGKIIRINTFYSPVTRDNNIQDKISQFIECRNEDAMLTYMVLTLIHFQLNQQELDSIVQQIDRVSSKDDTLIDKNIEHMKTKSAGRICIHLTMWIVLASFKFLSIFR